MKLQGVFPPITTPFDHKGDLYKANYSGVLNLMYLQALRHGAAISELAGDSQKASEYNARAHKLTSTITKTFWSDTAKVWVDGYDPETKTQIDEVSQHMNALAMLLGLKKEARAKLAREVLIKAARQRKEKIVPASPFFYAYVLESVSCPNQFYRGHTTDLKERPLRAGDVVYVAPGDVHQFRNSGAAPLKFHQKGADGVVQKPWPQSFGS